MDVESFVATTLVQIAKSIQTANDQIKDTGCTVGAPSRVSIKDTIPGGMVQDGNGKLLSLIDFDIAVTATSETEASGKIKVPLLEAGGGGSAGNSNVSRVKFTLPLQLP